MPRAISTRKRSTGRKVGKSKTFPGHDFHCTNAAGEVCHVEMKGTTTSAESIFLTKNEVEHVRSCSNAALFIVANVTVSGDGANLVASGGDEKIFDPWVLDENRLVRTQFAYRPKA